MQNILKPAVIIPVIILLIIFLGYKKFMYRYSAQRYFQDPKVIELCQAAKNGDKKKIDKLISEGVDVNTIGLNNTNPLYWLFIANKETEKKKQGFRYLLEYGADPLVKQDKIIYPVLHLAASYIDPYYLQTILEVQPDIDIDFSYNENIAWSTPLIEAENSGRFENFKILLDHGADIEKKNHWGSTAIDMCNGNGSWQFTYELLKRGADYKGGDIDLISGDKRDRPVLFQAMEDLIYHPSGVTNFRGTDYRQKVVEFLREKGVEVNPWMPEDEAYRYENGKEQLYIKEENGKWVKFEKSKSYKDYQKEKKTFKYKLDNWIYKKFYE